MKGHSLTKRQQRLQDNANLELLEWSRNPVECTLGQKQNKKKNRRHIPRFTLTISNVNIRHSITCMHIELYDTYPIFENLNGEVIDTLYDTVNILSRRFPKFMPIDCCTIILGYADIKDFMK